MNLKFLFEGEEEAGSPHLAAVLENNRDLLRADGWLLCDGPVHQTRRVQVYFGARGIIDVEITTYGPVRPLHSGHYGNWAPDPAVTLAHVLAGLRDTEGRSRTSTGRCARRLPSPRQRGRACSWSGSCSPP